MLIHPSPAIVRTGRTKQFSVVGLGLSNSVVWSVEGGAANGTITAGGLYTAPAADSAGSPRSRARDERGRPLGRRTCTRGHPAERRETMRNEVMNLRNVRTLLLALLFASSAGAESFSGSISFGTSPDFQGELQFTALDPGETSSSFGVFSGYSQAASPDYTYLYYLLNESDAGTPTSFCNEHCFYGLDLETLLRPDGRRHPLDRLRLEQRRRGAVRSSTRHRRPI